MIPADEAQAAAEARLERCWGLLDDDDSRSEAELDELGLFCGCTTCIVREVLTAAWPVLKDHLS